MFTSPNAIEPFHIDLAIAPPMNRCPMPDIRGPIKKAPTRRLALSHETSAAGCGRRASDYEHDSDTIRTDVTVMVRGHMVRPPPWPVPVTPTVPVPEVLPVPVPVAVPAVAPPAVVRRAAGPPAVGHDAVAVVPAPADAPPRPPATVPVTSTLCPTCAFRSTLASAVSIRLIGGPPWVAPAVAAPGVAPVAPGVVPPAVVPVPPCRPPPRP